VKSLLELSANLHSIMPKNKIVFLIRAYNEATRIIGVIESIYHKGFTEVLVVDDGSTDGT
jgi:glycosyltransferase involved in cell wall biosynthesis